MQKAKESKLAKVEALNKLIPSLTSENRNARRYALSALLTLYSSSGDGDSSDNDLRSLADNINDIGDAETLEALAKKLNDGKLKKRAAELYAVQAEHDRREMERAEDEKNIDKVRTLLNAARDDIKRALALDPENAKAIYQLGVLLVNVDGKPDDANEKFNEVIRLIEGLKYEKDNEIYLRSYLRKTRYLYNANGINDIVCDSYRTTKRKYQEVGWTFDKEKEDQTLENKCK